MKRIRLLGIMILLTMILAGCGGKAKASDVKSVDDLEGKKIGVQIGTTGDIYASDYENDDAGTVIERYNKGNDAVTSLKNGKIDCVIIDNEPAKAFVAQNNDLDILEEPFAVEDYAICISKEKTQLKEKINKALDELEKEGTLDKIISCYIDADKSDYKYEPSKDNSKKNGTLVMATNAAFPPYEFYDDNKIVGIDADMAQAVADKLEMELKIEDMEFDSIINSVQGGKADIGVAGMTVTEERLQNIDFTRNYTTSKQVIIVRNNNTSSLKSITESFHQSFIEKDRYKFVLKGLENTLIIALFAVLLGVLIGFFVAIIRVTYEVTGKLKVPNFLCKIYLGIIRGTPTMIQLLIIYYVIFASVNISKILVAILAFAINSGAYVAEIMRGGIMALDKGQFEGARSLGLTHRQTMFYIIIPQAFKNTLPALANEFIVLIKETAISGYIGLQDLTMAGNIIRNNTYQAFFPLMSVAFIYLVIVVILTRGVVILERRLKKNER